MVFSKIPDEGGTTFSSTGGKGSISYTLEEISLAGGSINRLSERLRVLAAQLSAEHRSLSEAAFHSAYYPSSELGQIGSAQWVGFTAQSGLAELARDTTAAAANYAVTESAAASKTLQLHSAQALMAGYQASQLGPLAFLKVAWDVGAISENGKKAGTRDAAEGALNAMSPYIAGLFGLGGVAAYAATGGLSSHAPPQGQKAAGLLRHLADWSGINSTGDLGMRRVPPSEWAQKPEDWRPGKAFSDPSGGTPVQVEPTLAGVFQGSQDAYGYPPGSIVIDRLQRGDGTYASIIHLPGTEDWSTPDSKNPFDMEGNLEGMTSPQAEQFKQRQVLVQELMRKALADAGSLPGEETLITGHSGGGIHAAAAVASPAFLADVNVKMITIAGSPAGNLPVRSNIDVLDLGNDADIVTSADYRPPPNTSKWVTVTSHRPGIADGKGFVEVSMQAHDLNNYIQDAKAMEESNDPAIVGSREALSKFLGGGATIGVVGGVAVGTASAASKSAAPATITVKRTVYQGFDVNRDPPKWADTAPRPNPRPGPPPRSPLDAPAR